MALPSVNINQLSGGLGRTSPNEDGVVGFVAHGVATVDYVLGTVNKIYSIKGAEAVGIDAAYDLTNEVLVHYHLNEIFRLNPNAEVWFMLVPQATTLANILSTSQDFAQKLLRDADGRIKVLGVAINTTSPTAFSVVAAAIPGAQNLANAEFQEHRPVDIFIEGKNLPAIGSAPDLTALDAPDVSIVVGQDGAKAEEDATFAGMANIGTALGTYSRNRVHESIAWVAKGNLASAAFEVFLNPRLSNDNPMSDYTAAELDALSDKGYIFARTFAGYSGTYWNNDPTCTETLDDYSRVYLNRTIKKAIRTTYLAVVPYVNSPLRVDGAGRLDKTTKAMIEAEVRSQVAGAMSGEISVDPLVIADPIYDETGAPFPSILSDSTLRVMVGVVPFGKAEQIIAYIGFINPAIN